MNCPGTERGSHPRRSRSGAAIKHVVVLALYDAYMENEVSSCGSIRGAELQEAHRVHSALSSQVKPVEALGSEAAQAKEGTAILRGEFFLGYQYRSSGNTGDARSLRATVPHGAQAQSREPNRAEERSVVVATPRRFRHRELKRLKKAPRAKRGSSQRTRWVSNNRVPGGF